MSVYPLEQILFFIAVFFADPTNKGVLEHEIRFNKVYRKEDAYADHIVDGMKRLGTHLLCRLRNQVFRKRVFLYYYSGPRPSPIVIVDNMVYQGFNLARGKYNGPYLILDRRSELGKGLARTVEAVQEEEGTERWPSREAFRKRRER